MPSQTSGIENISSALYEHHAEMCKIFANPVRLMIINTLREREMSVAAVAERLGMALGSVSPHLLMMKQRRVLLTRKQGAQVFYRLANPKILEAFDLIREILYEQMQRDDLLSRELASEQVRRMTEK